MVRSVFRTLSSIYDGAFSTKTINYYFYNKASSQIFVRVLNTSLVVLHILKTCSSFDARKIYDTIFLVEAVTQRSSVKKVLLEILRNSLENASGLQLYKKKRLWHWCFPLNFVKFLRTPFLQNTSGGCFYSLHLHKRKDLSSYTWLVIVYYKDFFVKCREGEGNFIFHLVLFLLSRVWFPQLLLLILSFFFLLS